MIPFFENSLAFRNANAGGQEGQLSPMLSCMGGRRGIHTELFPFLLPSEGTFSDVEDGLIQENFSGGKPPDPEIAIVLLGDIYSEHCYSGKELEDLKPTPVEEHRYTCIYMYIYLHRTESLIDLYL